LRLSLRGQKDWLISSLKHMGWMRFLLAAAVVFQHSTTPGNIPLVDGHQAVRLFYIISGFYMALILGQKYSLNRQGLWIFYTNRAARIFPVYWVVLIGAAALYGGALIWTQQMPERFQWYSLLREGGHEGFLAGLGLSQLILFGLDWFSLFDFQGSILGLGGTVSGGKTVGFLCLVPQAWTLAVELMFYLFAPFLVQTRTRWLVALCGAGILLRTALSIWKPNESLSLNYFWFPLQIPFFLMGILSNRWMKISADLWRNQWMRIGGGWMAFMIVIGYGWIPASVGPILSCGAMGLLIPALFLIKGKSGEFLGELSYPIYVVHILVKWIMLGVLGVQQAGEKRVAGIVLLGASVLAAIGIEKLIGTRVEAWRASRTKML
jgi:peptidoglycan/LPS O-acetylase OafA/YrhL